MTKCVTVIDYGLGNLLSVSRAFEACGAKVVLAEDSESIISADYLVLPGVGAFINGMRELESRGLIDSIRSACKGGTPILGICLGMQMLFTQSEEHSLTSGIGIIPGRVVAIPNVAVNGHWRKTPHIGWSEFLLPEERQIWSEGLFSNIGENPSGYFVHSFACIPSDSGAVIAECEYDGFRLCAAVRQDNVHGCQFHPEKSGEVGLKILANFIKC